MIVEDERDTYAENSYQLPLMMMWTTAYYNLSWVRKLLLRMRGIFKTISNFVMDRGIDNNKQTWWNIYDNSTMPIK